MIQKLIEIDEHEIATNPNFRWKSMLLTFTRKQHGFFLFYFLEHVMPAPVLSAPLPGLSGSYQYLRSSYTVRTDP